MFLRATENYRFFAASGNLAAVRGQSAQVLEALAAGKNINRISDDPQGAVSLETLQASLERSAQYQRNLDLVRPWVDFTSLNLEYAETLLSQAAQIADSFGGDAVSDGEREAAVLRLNNILTELIDVANAKLGDRYVFGGSMTHAPPFSETLADPPATYSGDDGRLRVNADAGLALDYNISGASAFLAGNGNVDVFQAVYDLKTAIETNDAAGIQTQAGILNQACEQVRLGVARTGAILGRMELSQTHLTAFQTRVNARISTIQEADMAALAVQYYAAQTALEAAYSVSSQIREYSLLNFLK